MREKLINLLEQIDHKKSIGFFVDNDNIADQIIELINFEHTTETRIVRENEDKKKVCGHCGEYKELHSTELCYECYYAM